MSFGLKVYDESGNTRLDAADRQIRFIGMWTGTVHQGSPVTISVPGITNDGTWGVNSEGDAFASMDMAISENQITLSTNVPSGSIYRIQVFRI